MTEAVYDTATGRYLLIPQGSRLIGRYDSQVAFGQRRVLLVWTRLILPDTSSIALDRLPASIRQVMPGWRMVWIGTGTEFLRVRRYRRCWVWVLNWRRRTVTVAMAR